MNCDAERQAAEIRIRAERKTGRLLKEMKESDQRQGGGRPKKPSSGTRVSTVADLGLTYDESSKWHKLAEIPEEEFEARLNPSPALFCTIIVQFGARWLGVCAG
jgi:hypothetical protein